MACYGCGFLGRVPPNTCALVCHRCSHYHPQAGNIASMFGCSPVGNAPTVVQTGLACSRRSFCVNRCLSYLAKVLHTDGCRDCALQEKAALWSLIKTVVCSAFVP